MARNGPVNTTIESRIEFMASQSTLIRVGHFLKPFSTYPPNTLIRDLPPLAFTYNRNNSGAIALEVDFKGWQTTYQAWDEWVLRMEPHYGPIWKNLGIFNAIKNSTLPIHQHKDVVQSLARKWLPKTSSFVFKWGEASITLEDVSVLGGYPVSGESVVLPADDFSQEMANLDLRLREARRTIKRTGAKQVPYNQWIKLFQEDGSGFGDIEHVGFLVFWLSKYVFPEKTGVNLVGKQVHNIAIRLALGFKVALAPAVLASIYQNLRTLKEWVSYMCDLDDVYQRDKIEIWGPMHLVQIWAWERFPMLSPLTSLNRPGEQIMACWQGSRYMRLERALNVDYVMETSGVTFLWRPYTRIHPHHEDADEEALVMLVRPSELVGLGLIEQYLPHRVARQFGFDQDIPDEVPRYNQSADVAWLNYNRPVKDQMVYIPPRLVLGEITTKYKACWDELKSHVEAVQSQRRSGGFAI